MTSNQAVSTMLDIKNIILMDIIVLLWDRDEDSGLSNHHVMYFSEVAMEIYIDPICIGLWLCSFHIVVPMCILLWLRSSHFMEKWIHNVCLVAISLVNITMDLQCIGRQPCFESFMF
jgi:hypothetical protein